eukprot:6475937-Amphidinium_carterae.1
MTEESGPKIVEGTFLAQCSTTSIVVDFLLSSESQGEAEVWNGSKKLADTRQLRATAVVVHLRSNECEIASTGTPPIPHEVRWLEPKHGTPDVPNQLERTLPPHINFGRAVTLTGTDMQRCEGVSGTLEDFDSDRCIVRLADALGSRYVAVNMEEHNKLIPLRRNTCVRVAEDGADGEVWRVAEYDEDIQAYRLCSLVDLHRDDSTVEDELRCLEVHARGSREVPSI